MNNGKYHSKSYKTVVAQLSTAKHHFQLLGVHRGSTFAEIGRARSGLAKHVHPDVNSAPGAHDMMARVNAAYTELTTRMEAYVRELRLTPCTACKGAGFTRRQRGFTKTVETICPACHGAGGS